ncbi:hypothetical protein BO78DRAFT_323279 [Aspergillus sclerotiicarbonarius CBS 121057]|uniref:Uncharacterized protein n=1 Tax=Aspergillus sclerotiicarbonarius (strain CBS 121057 / IBT 28362) TaxID=1448318 RepID=A0A319DZF9_ASPSB|nr:hypothetical protein BO78DRAFT_323279 [Aspergillus sclerotiicarbonarius CBS 121057]
MHPPENERPSRRPAQKKEYWCETNENIKWFEIAAQHVLHEMTHLDSAGKQAGYPEVTDDQVTSHGTEDVSSKNYISNARKLAEKWQKNEASCEAKKEMPPYRNADSIAMAALGKYESTQNFGYIKG